MDMIELVSIITLCIVVLIFGQTWKFILEQTRHNKSVESLLADIRDRPKTGA